MAVGLLGMLWAAGVLAILIGAVAIPGTIWPLRFGGAAGLVGYMVVAALKWNDWPDTPPIERLIAALANGATSGLPAFGLGTLVAGAAWRFF